MSHTIAVRVGRTEIGTQVARFARVALAAAVFVLAPRASADAADAGTHRKLQTEHGSVHIWMPPGFDRARAGVVVYVHGYRNDADGVWSSGIVEQFRRSGRNALFIVPNAPSSKQAPVRWRSLDQLRSAVTRAGIPWPCGPIVAAGHSGGYRTLDAWAADARLDAILSLDAFYGDPAPLAGFLHAEQAPPGRKLIIVAHGTAQAAETFVRSVDAARSRSSIPTALEQFTPQERAARVLYLRSQYGHSAIITSGAVLPLLLQLTELPALAR